MEVRKGHGYLGVVQYDDTEDKIQCHVCGKWFKSFASHIRVHQLTAPEYKDKFGLRRTIPLASNGVLNNLREECRKKTGLFFNHKRVVYKSGKKWRRPGMTKAWLKARNKAISRARSTMSHKNKYGLCDLQMKARYAVVKNIVGGTPTTLDLKKYDYPLMIRAYRQFGDINTFRKWVGDNPIKRGELLIIPDIDLISKLRKFAKENHRIPVAGDFTNTATYISHFGSWSNALQMAGFSK